SIGSATEPIVHRQIAEGHSVCMHTFHHDYHRLYPGRSGNADAIVADHAWVLDRTRDVLGEDFFAHCYRYPGGHLSWQNLAPADRALAAQQVHWLDWNANSYDASTRMPGTEEEFVAAVIDDWVEEGSPNVMVVLMHDAAPKKLTAAALPALIRELRSKGFSFATLD
ncbi:MAG: polysaccharide deacetylase, partial [Propionibacterium sp.]|nr:polysaccharide deacetylase [Propionibacterium sp.]